MKNKIEKIPIGKIIQEHIFAMNISLSELSNLLVLSEKKILALFICDSIDLSLLYRLSLVVKFDFFYILSENYKKSQKSKLS